MKKLSVARTTQSNPIHDFGIGMTEISVGDDRVVDEHHQGQERAGAIDAKKLRALAFGAARTSAGAIVWEMVVIRAPPPGGVINQVPPVTRIQQVRMPPDTVRGTPSR